MRGQGRAQALMLIPLALAAASASAQDSGEPPPDNEHYQLRGELGVEYDSNAHRVEEVAISGGGPVIRSFLQRLVLSAQGADQVAPRHAIAWSATAAGKIFDAPAARSENVAIAQSSLVWRTALGGHTWLAPSGTYYEAFQSWAPEGDPAGERRDFRSLAPTLELRTGLTDSVDLGVTAGYRWLLFKPDRDFDFNGPTAGVNLRWLHDTESGSDWEARAGAAVEYRGFAGLARIGNCPPDSLPCPGTELRNDNFLMAEADVTRTGRVLAGVGYAFHHNGSNSFGETLIRHIAIARVATALPLGLYLAARADLSFVFYRDSIPVARVTDMAPTVAGKPFVNIEEENRSSVRVDLSRDVGARLRALLRYTFYANELGSSGGTYRRHTLLLSLAFVLEK
ncbi:MAG TPA: hypothetical protein VN903_04185 [Polyangia bacterium]|jgi:hypothetical protein|nr:hypothetical protein [Polyangia bacterium]